MRLKNLLHVAVVFVTGQMMFSCSSAEYYRTAPAKMEAYNTVKEKPAPAAVALQAEEAPALLATSEKATPPAPALEASVAAPAPAALQKKAVAKADAPKAEEAVTLEKRDMTLAEAEALAMAKERLASMNRLEKKELKSDLREAYRQSGGRTSIVEIILAVLLPPLAVFLHDGIGTTFWISIILTLLFYLPGIIYALLIVTDTI
ncbi:YqaE/Pmp3 family membrane protein [Pontibacter sp. E15-1]|uniref:YqaE/Pmp3 family membrane protein n=1 Tax=Pontibacter sp. E15-1 TaxID=2919918 RepID=UPI001F4FDB3F|nr:YqaE/Pmp3 family membrane protein [Pontibacter sp. E15-1]MCJ8163628.1 YqaE/Pmp3 family membrane protein [Pontibacter sp. E15-1]